MFFSLSEIFVFIAKLELKLNKWQHQQTVIKLHKVKNHTFKVTKYTLILWSLEEIKNQTEDLNFFFP